MASALRRLVLSIACYAIASTTAFAASLDSCTTAHLIASWKHDGFWLTSAVVAPHVSVDGNDVSYVGGLRAGGRSYKIYFDQVTDPGSEAHDAGHELIVTTGRGKFLGFYNIDDIEGVFDGPMRTEGSDVVFETERNEKGRFLRARLHFGPKGPPRRTKPVFGYDFTFQTPVGFRNDLRHPRGRPEAGARIARYCRHGSARTP